MDTVLRTPETFNMEDFGFEICEDKSGRRSYLHDKDYILNTVSKSRNKVVVTPIISLSTETFEFVIGLLGETVDVGINNKGYICLQPGKKRTVSISRGKHKKGVRANISIGCMRDKLENHYGKFKRIYVKVEPYGNFNAVIIKPTGERDD